MESIKVAVRIRALNKFEKEIHDYNVFHTPDEETIGFIPERFNELLRNKKLTSSQKENFAFSK